MSGVPGSGREHHLNEYGRTWLYSEHSVRNPGEAAREGNHETTDATIPLRRRSSSRSDAGPLLRMSRRRLTGNAVPLDLEFAQPLPSVCTAHGRPAVAWVAVRSVFYETAVHPRDPKLSFHAPHRYPPPSTVVDGDWPICDLCSRYRRRYRVLAGLLAIVMVANLVAVLVVARIVHHEPLIPPLALGVFPGSIPIGLLVMLWLYSKGAPRMKLRPIDDERFLRVAAHPNFGAAVQPVTTEPQSEPPTVQHYRLEHGRVVPDHSAQSGQTAAGPYRMENGRIVPNYASRPENDL